MNYRKWAVFISLLTLFLASCTNATSIEKEPEAEISAFNVGGEEKHKTVKYLRSDLTRQPYEITKFYDGSNARRLSAHLNNVKINDEYRTENSNIILIGTITEIESYAVDGAIKSDVYLSVEKVIKNDTDIDVNDVFSFYSSQGMVPRYEYADSLKEEFRKDFDENNYSDEEMQEMIAEVKTGDLLYEIGMTGLFFLSYYDYNGKVYETLPTQSVLLKLDEDTYISPVDYKKLYGSSLMVEYDNTVPDDVEDLSDEGHSYFHSTEDVESFTGLNISE